MIQRLVLLMFLFNNASTFGQKILNETFVGSKDQTIKYQLLDYTKNSIPNFVVVISHNSFDTLIADLVPWMKKNPYPIQFYFINKSNTCGDIDLIKFIKHITAIRKLIDSNFYIVSLNIDNNFSEVYTNHMYSDKLQRVKFFFNANSSKDFLECIERIKE